MPVFGKQDCQAWAPRVPLMSGFGTEAWELKGAEILQLSFEVVEDLALELIPPALHPSIPPYATLSLARFPESPVGPFCLAQVRVIARAGIRPRGYLLGAYTDSEEAAVELRSRWGFTVDKGKIALQVYHHRVEGQVWKAGQTIVEMVLENPETISGSDITYIDSLHLARVEEGGRESLVLVQVDPEYVFHLAQRGRPRLVAFRGEAWGAGELLRFTNPIVATFTRCDTDLPRLRFAMDPALPAVQGSRRIAA